MTDAVDLPARPGLVVDFEREGTSARFELFPEQAPATVKMLWQSLPVTTDLHHCIAAGHEVFSLLPPHDEAPPVENSASHPAAGDLWFIHLASDFQVVPPGSEPDPRGIFDLAFWYGEDSWAPDGNGGMLSGSHIGRLESSLDQFASGCEGVWMHGSDVASIRGIDLDRA